MNLLHDKRDQENNIPKPDFHEVTPPPRIEHNKQFNIDPIEDSPYLDRNTEKKKGSGKAFILMLILLMVVSAAAYFLLFQKNIEIPFLKKSTKPQVFVQESHGEFVDPAEENPVEQTPQTALETLDSTDKNANEAPATTPPPVSQTTQQPVAQVDASNAFGFISQIVSQIQELLGNADKINTLILDERTLLAEIQATDMNAAAAFYASFQTQLGNVVQVTSSKPTSAKFLLSGNVNIAATTATESLTGTQIQNALNNLLDQQGVQNLGIEVTANSNGSKMVFVKLGGSLEKCTAFVAQAGKLPWGIKLSKAIFTPASGNTMTLTLRFIVH